MSVASADVPYRLEELGWLQFQRLCDAVGELLGVAPRDWDGTADHGRVAVVDRDVTLPAPLGSDRLAGPVTLLALFGYGRPSKGAAASARGELRAPGHALVLTNMAADRVRGRLGTQADGVLVAGQAELGRLLDASPDLRLRLPSVLGVRDLRAFAEGEAAGRSAFDLAAAANLARVFVPTVAYAAACDTLRRHGFAVLLGPPEMGKTAIARMIGLAQLTRGWEVHECIRPEQVLEAYRRDRPQVFVADDAFGSTEYRPDAADRWALDLDRILRGMDERHWLLWTSRPAPLNAGLRRVHREHGVERFPQPAEVYVDAADLSIEEKALILFRHALAAQLPAATRVWLRARGWRIVADPHFTPERIRRFAAERLPGLNVRREPDAVTVDIEAELREPTAAMATSLEALAPEHRALLVAMLDVPPGPVSPRELASAARRHAPAGLVRPVGELLDRLTDHFLTVAEDGSVGWVHPSWRDLVIDRVVADPDARARFLTACGLDGLLLALSTAGGPAGARALPLLVEDADWDALAGTVEGVVPRLDDPGLRRLLAALDEAMAAEENDRRFAELAFVAGRVLERSRPGLERPPVALGPLETWLRLADRLDPAPAPPDLARIWADLLPGTVDPASATDAGRVDDWARLLEIVAAHAPDLLTPFRHPASSKRAMRGVFAQLARAVDDETQAPVPGAWDLYARAVTLLGLMFRDDWAAAHRLAARLRTMPPEPREPPSRPLIGFSGSGSESDAPTVERILQDLTPPGHHPFFRR